jgi:hypothetical protein
VVASKYPSGHPGAGVPAGPLFPYLPINAYSAVRDGTFTILAVLELITSELVDGIPNGKNILTI